MVLLTVFVDDKVLRVVLAVHDILSTHAEDNYVRADSTASIAMPRFKKYRDQIRNDIRNNPTLQEKLEKKINPMFQDGSKK